MTCVRKTMISLAVTELRSDLVSRLLKGRLFHTRTPSHIPPFLWLLKPFSVLVSFLFYVINVVLGFGLRPILAIFVSGPLGTFGEPHSGPTRGPRPKRMPPRDSPPETTYWMPFSRSPDQY